jgi:hypothetical protein
VSYRELLGTAERIIDMDQQMREVEVILGQTGQKCNARAVSRMSKSFGRMQAHTVAHCRLITWSDSTLYVADIEQHLSATLLHRNSLSWGAVQL